MEELAAVIAMLAAARRPMILVGGGVRIAGGAAQLQELVNKTHIPVVSSLMGLDVIPHDHPTFFGMIGAYGNRYSNMALANCDLLLVLGSRLDSRQTGTRVETFARSAKRIHVDIDPVELNAKVPVHLAIQADVGEFLAALNDFLAEFSMPDISEWYRIIGGYRERYPTVSLPTEPPAIEPNLFMEQLSSYCRAGEHICLDVGQNQMWAGQSFRLKEGQRMLNSGGMGAMGFALPAAIGATLADPGHGAVVICGDGGIQVNIQELDTVARLGLPIKIFIMNNGCLGMVRQFQDMYFGGRQQSTVIGYGCPDLVRIAEAYGIPALTIDDASRSEEMIRRVLSMDGPVLVNVLLQQGTCVNPKLVVNRPIEDMSPHLSREDLAKEMLIDLVEEGEVPK
jgi:acetolactate synthase-1/2/3 large subunit